MKVYFHKFYTEAHRRWRRGAALADALDRHGIECSLVLDSSCDLALCGAFSLAAEFDEVVHREQEFRFEQGRQYVPTAHLCWDLYPMHVFGTRRGMTTDEKRAWSRYVANLKKANLVIAPSVCSAERMEQVLIRPVKVCLAACDPWCFDESLEPFDGGWVVDVMRKYDDPLCGAVKRVCDSLKIECIELGGKLPFDDFKRAILGARLLVSAYSEASTGGLTLLEGLALGKPSLCNSMRYNGAREYLGSNAAYFDGTERGLREAIGNVQGYVTTHRSCGEAGVKAYYSDDAMAVRLAPLLKEACRA
jgi:hypothetical protein